MIEFVTLRKDTTSNRLKANIIEIKTCINHRRNTLSDAI